MSNQINLWVEGFSCTGNSANASFCGSYNANNLKEAVEMYAGTLDEERKKYIDYERLTDWGCSFFDNEQDARKSFG